MDTIEVRKVARVVVGVAAVLVQIGLTIFYAGWSLFVLPLSAIIVLLLLMLAALVVVFWLAIRDAWLAPLVPIASFITWSLIYAFGTTNLGWGA